MFDHCRESWINQANAARPIIQRKTLRCFTPLNPASVEDLSRPALGRWTGERKLLFDAGEHVVGRLSLRVRTAQAVTVSLRFGEILAEVLSTEEEQTGQLPGTWLAPVSVVAKPELDALVPGRRAFRYVLVESACPVDDLAVVTETSLSSDWQGDDNALPHWQNRVNEVAFRTLKNCCQDVFEDGPKRDHRLWLGDLRLEAIASYASVPAFDVIKRSLYLLAACSDRRGMIPACVFPDPDWHRGTEWIPDYSLLFGATLLDYASASGDYRPDYGSGLLMVRRAIASGIEQQPPLFGYEVSQLTAAFEAQCAKTDARRADEVFAVRDGILRDAGGMTYKMVEGEFKSVATRLAWPRHSTMKDFRHLANTSLANGGVAEYERRYLLGQDPGNAAIVTYTHLNKLAEHYAQAVHSEMSCLLEVVEKRVQPGNLRPRLRD